MEPYGKEARQNGTAVPLPGWFKQDVTAVVAFTKRRFWLFKSPKYFTSF
jgi:hypothetical protein